MEIVGLLSCDKNYNIINNDYNKLVFDTDFFGILTRLNNSMPLLMDEELFKYLDSSHKVDNQPNIVLIPVVNTSIKSIKSLNTHFVRTFQNAVNVAADYGRLLVIGSNYLIEDYMQYFDSMYINIFNVESTSKNKIDLSKFRKDFEISDFKEFDVLHQKFVKNV